MTKFLRSLAAVAAIVAAPLSAFAAKTQASPGSFKAAGKTGYVYGRSDGVYQEENTKAPYIIENGTPALAAGFGYSESFTPGVYAAVPSALLTIAGLVQSASAQQLDIGYFGPHAFIFGQSTAQTILPVMDSIGLDISGDQVSAEAYEMFAGILGASGRPAVVGYDPAFYFCATIAVADASGASDLHVGWRSATETQVKLITSYSNYATIGIEGTANPNTIYTMTGNDGTDASLDSTLTWADAAEKRLCTLVSATGAVTYTVDGVLATSTAFSFDDGDSLIPFIAAEQSADLSGAIDVTLWEVGYSD
jgi:hypothetical protein